MIRRHAILLKNQYIILINILLLSIITASTYAFWVWSSHDNKNVLITVNDVVKILYVKGRDITNALLTPSSTKENGIKKTIKVSLEKESNMPVIINFYLDIGEISDELKSVSFKWELYKNNELLNENNFSNVSVGGTLNLTSNQLVTTKEDIYSLYIWIDENSNVSSNMSNKNFRFMLYADGHNATYNEIQELTPESCFAFDEETRTITKYYSNEYNNAANPLCPLDVVIPSKIKEIPVENLYSAALAQDSVFYRKNITSVILPDTLQTIGAYSFYANKLTGILTIPKSVKTIGNSAFYGSNLSNDITGIIFESESSLETIGNSAFYFNKLQGTLTIPKSVKTIGNQAFFGSVETNQITELIFESGSLLETIGISAFAYNKLSSLTIPSKVTTIEKSAFIQANNLLTSIINTPGLPFSWCDNPNGIILSINCSPLGKFVTVEITVTGTYARIVKITTP